MMRPSSLSRRPSISSNPPSRVSTPTIPSPSVDLPTRRLMQVKVLYTFDDDSKTNCLARCPAPLPVQTANLDDGAQIGIIELRTCIQAIVTASPELVAKLGHDYTVYAYDFSEYETPLVGQGMLSWVLASSSATPNAPAEQSRTMVTGRVSKSIMGLFSQDGVKEMLEVKLRLVPVPTCLQSEYLASMQKYRDASTVASADFDSAAWTAFLRANPGFGNAAAGSQDEEHPEPQEDLTLDAASGELLPAEEDSLTHHSSATVDFVNEPCAQMTRSRPSTPSLGTGGQNGSRPSSRNSNIGLPTLKPRGMSYSYGPIQPTPIAPAPEDGPARKRAKIEQISWRGPSAFGLNNEPLRVTASAAASIRGRRPPTNTPSASELAAGELSARPPTPRPMPPRIRHGLVRTDTSLAQDAIARSTTTRKSSTLLHNELPESSFSAASSPIDAGSAASTPADIPSSPPIMHTVSPAPSSPALPAQLGHRDSGFFSGPIDEEDFVQATDAEDRKATKPTPRNVPPNSELSFTIETPGDPGLLPKTSLRPRPKIPKQPSKKRRPESVGGSSPKPLPPCPTPSDCSNSQQKHVESGDDLAGMVDEPQRHDVEPHDTRPRSASFLMGNESESAAPEPSEPVASTVTRAAGSGVKRRKAIQGRLMADIAAGKMPPYCKNCGQINTPTWRKAFVKIENGNPEDYEFPENDEGHLAWEALDRQSEEEIISFRIIRKWLSGDDKGFDEWQLCNSCGIHLFKYKVMRPPEKWNKEASKDVAPSKKRPPRSSTNETRRADGREESQMDAVRSFRDSANSGANSLLNRTESNDFAIEDVSGRSDKSQSKTLDGRPHSEDMTSRTHAISRSSAMTGSAAALALQKAFQSSPPKFPGSKISPIDVEQESSPVRRVLFPSPRKASESKSNAQGGKSRCEEEGAGKHRINVTKNSFKQADKENLAPDTCQQSETIQPPQEESSPSSIDNKTSPKQDVLVTPTKKQNEIPHDQLSSASKRWLGSLDASARAALRKSGQLQDHSMSPFTAQLTRLISQANDSPSKRSPRHSFPMYSSDGLEDENGLFAIPDFGAGGLGMDMAFPTSEATFFDLQDDPMSAVDDLWSGGAHFGQGQFLTSDVPDSEMQPVEEQQSLGEEQIGTTQ